MQMQTAVTAYLKSKQLLLFVFARQNGDNHPRGGAVRNAPFSGLIPMEWATGNKSNPISGDRDAQCQDVSLALLRVQRPDPCP